MQQACLGLLVTVVDHFRMIFVGTVYSRLQSLVLDLMSSGWSLMKIKNRTGPRTDPWGTPLTMGTFSKDCPSTCWVLKFRNDDIHWYVVPQIP